MTRVASERCPRLARGSLTICATPTARRTLPPASFGGVGRRRMPEGSFSKATWGSVKREPLPGKPGASLSWSLARLPPRFPYFTTASTGREPHASNSGAAAVSFRGEHGNCPRSMLPLDHCTAAPVPGRMVTRVGIAWTHRCVGPRQVGAIRFLAHDTPSLCTSGTTGPGATVASEEQELPHPTHEVRLVLIQRQLLFLREIGVAVEHLVQRITAIRHISVSCLSRSGYTGIPVVIIHRMPCRDCPSRAGLLPRPT